MIAQRMRPKSLEMTMSDVGKFARLVSGGALALAATALLADAALAKPGRRS